MFKNKLTTYIFLYLLVLTNILSHAKNRKTQDIGTQDEKIKSMQDINTQDINTQTEKAQKAQDINTQDEKTQSIQDEKDKKTQKINDKCQCSQDKKIKKVKLKNAHSKRHKKFLSQDLNISKYVVDNRECTPECCLFKPITLDEVSKIARANRQDLASFDYLIESNWHAERAALGEFLPQVTITADSGKSSKEEVSGLSQWPKESVTIDASLLIFSFGGPRIRYKMAQEDTQIAAAQKNILDQSIRFNAETAFLELKKQIIKKELIENLNDSSKITFDQSETRKKAGFLNRAQFASAESTFCKDQTDVSNYPVDVDIAIKMLERETNIDIHPVKISLDQQNLDKIKLLSEEQYYKVALANRPDLVEKNHQIKQADYSNQFYKYKYVPEIYLTTNVQKAKMLPCPPPNLVTAETFGSQPFDNFPLNWHIGVSATWNFDGLTNFNTSKQYDDLSTSFILKKRDLELNIMKDIQALINDISNDIDLIKPAKKNLEAAATELDNIKTQYEVGLAALYQYKQAQLAHKQAEFELTTLKIDLRTKYQKLLFACGYAKEISS